MEGVRQTRSVGRGGVSYARAVGVAFGLAAIAFSGVAYLTGDLVYRGLYVALGVSAFLVVVIASQRYAVLAVASIVFIALFASSLPNIDSSGWRSLFGALLFLASFGIGWAALYFNATRLFLELPFLVAVTAVALLGMFFGYGYQEFNTLLEGSSRNVLSAILLMLGSGYLFSKWYRDCAPSLIPFFILMAVSVSLYGRTGIAFSVAISVLAAFARFGAARVALFLLVVASLGVIFGGVFSDALLERTNFQRGLESERFLMLSEYLLSLDAADFILGKDLWEVGIISDYGGNPHNAFLRMHAYYGIFAVIFFAFIFVCFCLHLVNGRWVLASLLVVVMARAFFDIVVLFNLIDFAIFPILFYSIYFPRGRSYCSSGVKGSVLF